MKEDIILAGRGILVWAIRDSPNAVALVFNADCRPREEGQDKPNELANVDAKIEKKNRTLVGGDYLSL